MRMHMLAMVAVALWTIGCGDSSSEPKSEATTGWEEGAITERSAEPAPPADREPAVEAELESAEGAEIEGEAKFFPEAGGVRVVVEVAEAPAGLMGVHIHEKGDCSAIEAESMGAHYAPEGAAHALPEEQPAGARHTGDLGNIEVGPDGKGRLEAKVEGVNLQEDDANTVRGRAIVVHSRADVGQAEQPSGASGTALACAVIE